ncbi:chemotaxis protein CheW [Holophaga foetida]|uniref:chemotaxis protein CheW n=1 Tax=Holophaga foetida TaxID=35839 RepID=UPI00024750D3|nr:chemotaxis protein CheW [Holophaga foetida]
MAEQLQMNKRQNQALVAAKATQRNQYLTFTLGGETFAMEIRFIREVIQFGGLTIVPLMPDFIRGVINLRGAVVPVIDLSVRFHRPPTEPTKRTCIVILEVGQEDNLATLGVLVDNVSEVLEIQGEDIEPAPSFGSSLRSDFIQGVGKVGGKFVIILEVNQVVSVEELASLAANRGAAEAIEA